MGWFDEIGYAGPMGTSQPDFQVQSGQMDSTDPFGYSGGSLLTPWTRTFQAPPGSGGGASVPAFTPFSYGDFGYGGFRDPGQLATPTPFKGPDPFSFDKFTPAQAYTPGAFETGAPYQAREYTPEKFTAPEKFTYGDFKAPTQADAENDAGYQFSLKQGLGALSNDRAARGLYRTGGTGQALIDYGQDRARQQYQDVYNRRAGEYATNRGNAAENYDRNFGNAFSVFNANEGNRAQAFGMNEANRFGAYTANEQNRLNAFGLNEGNRFNAFNANEQNRLNAYRTNYDTQAQTYDRNFQNAFQAHQANTGNALNTFNANVNSAINSGRLGYDIATGTYDRNYANARQGWQDAQNYANAVAGAGAANANQAYNRALNEYQMEYDQFNRNQDTQFSRLFALANLGQGSAMGYGNVANSNILGAGNANAAGQVGSANAWGNAFGNIANAGMGLAGMYYANQNSQPRMPGQQVSLPNWARDGRLS